MFQPSTSCEMQKVLVPEILAPAGGREQFFAALRSGADAVYLGLKHFNARARAENFSTSDLTELVPLAHRSGMKVLVTLNILIKEAELSQLVDQLILLEQIRVDAVIVQDLGVVELIKRFTPTLRIHGSTQMAIHNLAGVNQAASLGLSRVVLARELTITELRRMGRPQVELEVFCHGSLCYSYSGLCFFSGAEDARSGNRGECAYTCRKPYKIISEPGHGFLFSMKDLDTSKHLDQLIQAGVHTLKIEGRKKDAQYVTSTVRLYRQRLDQLFGFATGRRQGVDGFLPEDQATLEDDLKVSFQRERTSFFTLGRYHENVIDLDHASHQGMPVGQVTAVVSRGLDRFIQFEAKAPLDRFDGLRILPKADASAREGAGGQSWQSYLERYTNHHLEFSLREMSRLGGGPLMQVHEGVLVEVKLPAVSGRGHAHATLAPSKGDLIYKVRSQSLKDRVAKLSRPPQDHRPIARLPVDLAVTWEVAPCQADQPLNLTFTVVAFSCGTEVYRQEFKAEAARAHKAQAVQSSHGDLGEDSTKGSADGSADGSAEDSLARDIASEFRVFGDVGLQASELSVSGPGGFFVPKSFFRQMKKQLAPHLLTAIKDQQKAKRLAFDSDYLACPDRVSRPLNEVHPASGFVLKIDSLDLLEGAECLQKKYPDKILAEVIFEPKKGRMDSIDPKHHLDLLKAFNKRTGLPWRLALPTVIRGWDEPMVKLWTEAALAHGCRSFEVGNLGALRLLKDLAAEKASELDIHGDFTLYTLNSFATASLRELGLSGTSFSIEDDRTNLALHLKRLQQLGLPESLVLSVIVYKDTPLFIAEACSLTALHKGCPGAKVCGYRTLEVENSEGERFFVAHETCKSIVYGAKAFSLCEHVDELQKLGVHRLRLDFLTRPYSAQSMMAICERAFFSEAAPKTHGANFTTHLL